jgi:hydroxymethylpyrimidine/phosphomethylpyrimidine kinase
VPEAVDVFCDGSDTVLLKAPFIAASNTHGTGCVLSAAIAAYLSLGDDPLRAAKRAKRDVTRALEHALDIGGGSGPVILRERKNPGKGVIYCNE